MEIIEEGKYKYLEQGEGPVLLLLHGLFGALSNFKEVVDHFSKEYRVLIPMMPIYELPVLDTNVKKLSEFIVDFIEFKQLKNINLLGNSLGGHVALVYTSKHQENVKSLK